MVINTNITDFTCNKYCNTLVIQIIGTTHSTGSGRRERERGEGKRVIEG